MTLTDADYRVYMVHLPGSIRGAVRVDGEGFASIYINDALSPAAKKATFLHELRHISRDDIHNELDIRTIERTA